MDSEYLRKIMKVLNIGQFDLSLSSRVGRHNISGFLLGHRDLTAGEEKAITVSIEKNRQRKLKELDFNF